MSTPPVNAVKISQPEDVSAASLDDAKISDFQDVASYNWLDEPTPTILVPGIPPMWNPPSVAPHLKPDSGTYYVDQNEDRNPRSLLEPLILAVLHMQPDFDLALVDIITDRRPLHLLHAFVNGNAHDFEFKAEVIHDTILFARKEEQSRRTIAPGEFAGYRHAFEEEYTSLKGCAKGSTSHHRIMGYNFGGFRFLIRSAVDAYLENLTVTPEESRSVQVFDEDDIAKYMKSASLVGEAPTTQRTSKIPVTVVDGGEHIPHGALLELKTRSKFSKSPFTLEDKIFDLWVSQTPNFVLASYQNATLKRSAIRSFQPRLAEFVDLDVKPMRNVLKEWESKNEEKLRRLLIVLRKVVEAVKIMHAPCVVRYEQEAGLQVLRLEDETHLLLPKDLYDKWLDFADLSSAESGDD